jgi:hypothetical protein
LGSGASGESRRGGTEFSVQEEEGKWEEAVGWKDVDGREQGDSGG